MRYDSRDRRIAVLRQALEEIQAKSGSDWLHRIVTDALEDDCALASAAATAQPERDRLVKAGADKARLDFVTKAVREVAELSLREALAMSANFLYMTDALRAWEAEQTTESAADLTDTTTERAALAGGRDEELS